MIQWIGSAVKSGLAVEAMSIIPLWNFGYPQDIDIRQATLQLL